MPTSLILLSILLALSILGVVFGSILSIWKIYISQSVKKHERVESIPITTGITGEHLPYINPRALQANGNQHLTNGELKTIVNFNGFYGEIKNLSKQEKLQKLYLLKELLQQSKKNSIKHDLLISRFRDQNNYIDYFYNNFNLPVRDCEKQVYWKNGNTNNDFQNEILNN